MKLKNIFFSSLLCLISVHIYGQNNLSGRMTDSKTGEPLAGALIFVSDIKTGTASDINGHYLIENLKEGSYFLEISLIGYKSITRRVFISGSTQYNFELPPSVTELNEVIITGVGRSVAMKQSPVVVKSIRRDHFLENTSTNLIDGLKNVPGISQITTGASISKPVIRGLGFNRIITLNNGIRQEGQQWGDEHGIEIDEYGVNRVEIIKGPGSLMYGSDGIGGVINFLPPKPLLEGKTHTQWISNYQSNNNQLGNSLSYSGNKNGLQWQSRLSNKLAGAYKNNLDGKVFNSGSNELNGSLLLGLNKQWGFTHLNLNSYNTHLGIITGERNHEGEFILEEASGVVREVNPNDYKAYKIGFPNQKINHHGAALNSYVQLGKGALASDIGFQTNSRREFEDPSEPDEAELFLRLNTLSYNLRYHLDKRDGWESTVGVGGMYQLNKNLGEEFLIPDYNLLDGGIFIFTQKTFNKITFATGLRADSRLLNSKELHLDGSHHPVPHPDENTELKFKAIHQNFSGISGSVGVSYPISTTSTLKMNFSRGYRAPNIAELASNGKHEGTFRYEIGNEQLKPEISHQFDLAYYLAAEHITLEVSPFINHIDNFVYLHKLQDNAGNTVFPDQETPGYQFTSGKGLLYGSELYLDIHPHPLDWLHLENTFSWVRGVQINQPDSMRNLPMMPAPKYRGELKFDFSPIGGHISNTFIKFSIDHYFKQNRVFEAYNTETATPAYTLLGAGIGTQFKRPDKEGKISLFINGENLTNLAYQSHLSRLKYAPVNPANGRMGVFNMGMNISLKLIIEV